METQILIRICYRPVTLHAETQRGPQAIFLLVHLVPGFANLVYAAALPVSMPTYKF